MFGRLITWIFVLILSIVATFGWHAKGLPWDKDKIKVYVDTRVPVEYDVHFSYEDEYPDKSEDEYPDKSEDQYPDKTELVYKNCREVPTSKGSGVYNIGIDSGIAQVYCEINSDGTKYLVIQRRIDGSQDFNLNFKDYEEGFGNPQREFWIGNKILYQLTSKGNYKLRVDLEASDSTKAYAVYDTFSVGSPETKYKLNVAGYSGNAGDSLTYHNGQMFTTHDSDNDEYATNCAVLYKGAWWYKSCHVSNLNGFYYGGPHKSYADGVNWNSFKGYYDSMKLASMKIYG